MSLANRGNMSGKDYTSKSGRYESGKQKATCQVRLTLASQGDMSLANRGNMPGKVHTNKLGRYESGKQRQHAR